MAIATAVQVAQLDQRLVAVQESTQALEDGIYDQVQWLVSRFASPKRDGEGAVVYYI